MTTERDTDGYVFDDEMPRRQPPPPTGALPKRGDLFTLYTLDEAAAWFQISAGTFRHLVRRNLIPRRFLSKPSPGKTMICADAIHELAAWFREVEWETLYEAPLKGRTPRQREEP